MTGESLEPSNTRSIDHLPGVSYTEQTGSEATTQLTLWSISARPVGTRYRLVKRNPVTNSLTGPGGGTGYRDPVIISPGTR